jgi:NAD(P)H-hydrate epimerase
VIVVNAEEMRALDERTIVGLGVPGVVLMESAGRAVADVVDGLLTPLAGAPVAVVAGPGNNGGDGCVVARHLHHRGARVALLLVADEARVRGDARTHLEAARRSGVPLLDARAEGFAACAPLLDGAAVIVDALLGTGTARPVEGHLAAVIARMNGAPGLRVAVDVPSGLDVDRGQPLGACVQAHHTVTFALAKVGLVTAPGFTFAGELHVADIGIPPSLVTAPRTVLLDDDCLAPLRAPRPPLAHKGTFGHVLVVAGSRRHPGAALLAARAAARAGAGLVTLATSDETAAALAPEVREVSLAPLAPEEPALDARAAWARLEPALDGKRAVVFGCGLGRAPAVRALLERLLAAWDGPLVVDADGLNVLAADTAPLVHARSRVVLTPHPTEMARLAGVDTTAVQADRLGTARAFAAAHRATVVLKGARTVIAAPDGRAAINPTGNPGLATGGTGDVLAGVTGALCATGLPPFDAAAAAVYLHGRAGDLARDAIGEAGLLAGDLIDRLPAARRR